MSSQDSPRRDSENHSLATPVDPTWVEHAHADEDLRLMADSARDFAMIFTDPDRNVVRWSKGAEAVLGWTEQEAIGTRDKDLIYTPEDVAAGVPDQEQHKALQEGRSDDERWHLKKDGTRFFAMGVMVPLYDPYTQKLRGFGKILRDMTLRKRLEDDLKQSKETLEARVAERTAELTQALATQKLLYAERQRLAEQLVAGMEQERRRISRELHDQTGQHLAALGLELGAIQRAAIKVREASQVAARVASEAAIVASEAANAARVAAETAMQLGAAPDAAELAQTASEAARNAGIAATDARAAAAAAAAAMAVVDEAAPGIERIRHLNESLSRDLHRLAIDLRPTSLDDLGLIPALWAYMEQWSIHTGIRATFTPIGFSNERLPPVVETTMYRIVQEAMNNVAKYAVPQGAMQISVTIQRFDGNLQATVEDDGPGFDVETALQSGRLGLSGMQERAELVGGTLEVESAPGEGTTIYLRVPLQLLP